MSGHEDGGHDEGESRGGGAARPAQATGEARSAGPDAHAVAAGGSGPLGPRELTAYFALMQASSVLHHVVEQQLHDDGGISYVQFQILASLRSAPDHRLRMTDLADRLVYSRSGLTYQVSSLAKAGYVTRTPSRDDERSVMVTATRAGLDVLEKVFGGHVEVVRQALFAPLGPADVETLGDILGRVRDHQQTFPPRSAAPRAASRRSAEDAERAGGEAGVA